MCGGGGRERERESERELCIEWERKYKGKINLDKWQHE